MTTKRMFIGLAIIAVVVISLGGAYLFFQPPAPETPVTLVLGVTSEADNLDLPKTTWLNLPAQYVYENLISVAPNGEFKDGLAESWETAPDGNAITFHLKHGVTFHDGTPFNAEAVKYNIEVRREGSEDYIVAPIEEVVILDEYTVVFKLSHPDANMIFNLASDYMAMMSPAAREKYGEDYGVKVAVGTGPFVLKEWIHGDRSVLVRNENYAWGQSWVENKGPAYVEEIIIKVIPEDTTRILEFESGAIDVLFNVPPNRIQSYRNNPSYTVIEGPGTGAIPIWFNVQKPPFDDARVRRAIGFAIDRESILENVFYGMGQPAYNLLPPSVPEHNIAHDLDFSYQVEKARSMLEDAGWFTGPDGILEKDGKKFVVDLMVTDAGEMVKLAEVVQAQLKEIGIEIRIIVYDWTTFHAKLRAGEQEMYLRLWDWPNGDILNWFFNSDNIPYPNHARFNDTALDEILNAGMGARTWEEHVEMFSQAHTYLLERAVWVPITYWGQAVAFRSNVTGFEYHTWYIALYDVVDVRKETQ